jgi:general nucleoside transport system permease protein
VSTTQEGRARPARLQEAVRSAGAELATRAHGVRLTGTLTLGCLAVAVALSALLVALSGGSPVAVVQALYAGSFSGPAAWSQTLVNATPLLLVALGSCVANRAGVFNIGQEGQLIVGAMAGCYVALHLAGPGWVVVPVALAVAALGGGAWAGISGVMHYTRGTNIIVSTLLLTFVGVQLVQFAVNSPAVLQQSVRTGGTVSAQSDLLPEYLRLGSFGEYPGLAVGYGFLVAIVATAVLAVLLGRSRWGFRIRMLGFNPLAARHAGIRASRLGGGALALSGAFAGLAGGIILMGTVFRLQPAMANNFGWDGMLVALVARGNPVLAVPVALVFGALRSGASYLATTGVPDYLVDIVQALIVLAFVVPPVLAATARLRARHRGTTEESA